MGRATIIALLAALAAAAAPERGAPNREASLGHSQPDAAEIPFRSVMAMQARLDGLNFSCGCVDGVMGPRTRAAIAAWRGTPDSPVGDEDILEAARALGGVEGAFAVHEVTDEDAAGLSPVPLTWAGKARMESLGHETVLERLAERYHASQGVIRRLNPGVLFPNPAVGERICVPRLFMGPREHAARLSISLERQLIRAYDANGRLAASFPCSVAARMEKRPVGDLRVANAAENPNYTFDPSLFPEDAEARTLPGRLLIPAGPNNPVGTVWIGLDRPGYGIHGTPSPEDIGKTQSHGCFRLSNWNAEKLLRMIAIGTPVIVEP